MPSLEEYLGGLLHSINQARTMADVQTVHTAEQYARHDLLRHFSVPRLRLEDVELTIPIALESLGAKAGENRLELDREALQQAIRKELPAFFPIDQVKEPMLDEIGGAINARIGQLQGTFETKQFAESAQKFASELAEDFVLLARSGRTGLVRGMGPATLAKRLAELANGSSRPASAQTGIGNVQVIAESHRLREQRPEDIIHIKLKISEDAMEWQQIERSDGGIERKLLPE